MDKIKKMIGIELPEGDYELLKEEDKEAVKSRYESSKEKIEELILIMIAFAGLLFMVIYWR